MNRPRISTEKSIIEVDINKIMLWKDNPRRNDAAVPKLAEVIKLRGQITPIVVWRKNNVAYKGNTTLKALKSLGYKTIKVLYADFPSEQAAIAYGIADNKSSEWAEWDETVLRKFLNVPDMITQSGFTDVEKRALFFEPEPEKIKEINAANINLKDKIIIIVLDAAKRDMFKDMLKKWITSTRFKDVEVK